MGWRILKCSVLCWKCENLLHTSTCACFCVAHVNLPKQRMRQFFCYCNLQLNDGTLLLNYFTCMAFSNVKRSITALIMLPN